jgi:hypothetical protein
VAGSTAKAAEIVTGTTTAAAGSATVVATTWQVDGAAGATYTPSGPTVPQPGPSCTLQLTLVSAVPVTVATNRVDPPGVTTAAGGSTRTATPWAEDGGAAVVHAASRDRARTIPELRTDMECTSSFLRRERVDPRHRPDDCGSKEIPDPGPAR